MPPVPRRLARGVFRQEHPEGKACYTLTGNYTNFEPEADDTDEWALRNGYVSVVPVQVDMTNYGHLPFLEKILK